MRTPLTSRAVCDLDYDPFLFMEDKNKKYGFVLTIYEYRETIATLWDETKSAFPPPSRRAPLPFLSKHRPSAYSVSQSSSLRTLSTSRNRTACLGSQTIEGIPNTSLSLASAPIHANAVLCLQ